MTQPTLHRRCRACGGDLTEVLYLGDLRLNAFHSHLDQIQKTPRIPHILCVCRGCSLAQLSHTTPQDWMFTQYWYRSGVNEAMVKELKTIVVEAATEVRLEKDDWVLDIGANDGTLLRAYQTPGLPPVRRVAVEPAANLATFLQDADVCDVALHTYFPAEALRAHGRKFTIITAIAMAYDLEDPTTFFREAAALLRPDGIMVVQFQDLLQQIHTCAFDNIVAEHLEYYTLSSLAQVVNAAGLYPASCKQSPINGGSLRVVLKRGYVRMSDWSPSVQQQINREHVAQLTQMQVRNGLQAFDRFRRSVERTKVQIRGAVEYALQHGPLDAYGASTKANTLFQIMDLGPGEIRRVADRSPEKVGRLTITGIPICSEEDWRVDPAGVTLCPIWQFKEGVLTREAEYLATGGQFLFALPQVEIVAGSY